jgi:AraC-like DNA-binding protein
LPVTGHVMDTGRTTLAFGMTLHPADIAALLLEADPQDLPAAPRTPQAGAAVTDAPAELLDAIVRLLRLLNHPGDRKVLAPMIKREILWRLLSGEQGPAIRQLGLADSSLAHITRTVQWIRENFAKSFRVEELAHLAGMSVSAFHRNFQAVTGMSPIRFQKHIRLQEARQLLAGRPSDITGVGHAVGYDSSSQFSREYHRMFGMPPSQDTVHLRPQPAVPAAAVS